MGALQSFYEMELKPLVELLFHPNESIVERTAALLRRVIAHGGSRRALAAVFLFAPGILHGLGGGSDSSFIACAQLCEAVSADSSATVPLLVAGGATSLLLARVTSPSVDVQEAAALALCALCSCSTAACTTCGGAGGRPPSIVWEAPMFSGDTLLPWVERIRAKMPTAIVGAQTPHVLSGFKTGQIVCRADHVRAVCHALREDVAFFDGLWLHLREGAPPRPGWWTTLPLTAS